MTAFYVYTREFMFPVFSLMLMTRWGFWSTLLTYLLGTYISFTKSPEREAYRASYSWCKLWKVWLLLFEGSLIFEIIITAFFWLILWPILKKTEYVQQLSPLRYAEVYAVHILPLFFLVVDWLLHAVPIAMRHISVMLVVGALYIVLNITVAIAFKPIYPVLTWDNEESYLLVMSVATFQIILYLVLCWINNCKLRCNKRDQDLEMLDVLSNRYKSYRS